MPYTPTNHPYIPGDPYSYDLKWLVRSQKETISMADLAATQAAQAISDAASALTAADAADSKADTAIATANSASSEASEAATAADAANSAASSAVNTANAALAAAQASEFEIIDIECDRDNNTAIVDSSYTWDELYTLAAANKVLFRLKDSGFSSAMVPTPFRPKLLGSGSSTPSLNSQIYIDGFYTEWSSGAPFNWLYIQRVWLMNSLSGTYYVGYTAITQI